MNDRAIQDLIDSYLLNRISPENKARLLDMMEADPVFAQHVRECEETFRVLQLARDRELRDKLRKWDAGVQKQNNRTGKGFMFLLLFAFLTVSFWCWLTWHFSPVTLAMNSFNSIPENAIIASQQSNVENWKLGSEAFHQKDFEKANLIFLSITETDPFLASQKRWNILLCQLAINGPSSDWMQGIKNYAESAPNPMQSQARKLWRKFQSPLYTKLYSGVLRRTFTAVKPRII